METPKVVGIALGISVVTAIVALGAFWVLRDPTNVSALSGPDIPSPYISWGGILKWNLPGSFQTATTSVCWVKSPVASSTLDWARIAITVGTTTDAIFDISTSTTQFASSSPALVKAEAIVSGATGIIAWQPGAASSTSGVIGLTKTSGASQNVLPPNTYVTFKTGAGLGGYTYTGSCAAGFTQI